MFMTSTCCFSSSVKTLHLAVFVATTIYSFVFAHQEHESTLVRLFRLHLYDRKRRESRLVFALIAVNQKERSSIKYCFGNYIHRITYAGLVAAKKQAYDVVLIDTAGRMHHNKPLMDSLHKLTTVNAPDLIVFVAEALVPASTIVQPFAENGCTDLYNSGYGQRADRSVDFYKAQLRSLVWPTVRRFDALGFGQDDTNATVRSDQINKQARGPNKTKTYVL